MLVLNGEATFRAIMKVDGDEADIEVLIEPGACFDAAVDGTDGASAILSSTGLLAGCRTFIGRRVEPSVLWVGGSRAPGGFISGIEGAKEHERMRAGS